MSTLVAVRYNPVLKAFYQRLCTAGKAKKGCVDGLHAQALDDSECQMPPGIASTMCSRATVAIIDSMVAQGQIL